MEKKIKRCGWANHNQLEQEYHDKKRGIPMFEDRELFKMLCLEGMQAGLSWSTILKKMGSLCEAYDDFIPEIVVTYDEKREEELLQNKGIIRNRLKVRSVAINAKVYFKVREEFGSFSSYVWGFVNGKPIINSWKSIEEVPAKTELSDKISKDLKKRGFKFVGSTIVYAFMQAVGMVNDHLLDCDFRRAESFSRRSS